MASITMTTSFTGTAATITSMAPASRGRRIVMANAAVKGAENSKLSVEAKNDCNNNGRRELMFAAAAAAVCSVAAVAIAEPKAGTPEARKFYAPVCVTNPTAKICHK